jgi:trans-aconitate 2-methyltransferase
MAPDLWDPERYERFKQQRALPAIELTGLLQATPGGSAADLGCGTGEPTERLHRHLGAAATVGVDSSPNMLERARTLEGGGLRFVEDDLTRWEPEEPLDVLFSNAALQWVGDHEGLFRRFHRWLKPGGQLAVQVPAGDNHPSHTVAARLGERHGTGPLYPGGRNVLPPEGYAALLFRLGFREQRVALRIYDHVLPGLDAMVDFFRSTLLTPWQAALPGEAYERFLVAYREGLREELGDPSPLFFPMPRILIWARRLPPGKFSTLQVSSSVTSSTLPSLSRR